MLRLVVATYLIIVTVAGPAACCCTFTRLAERFSSPAHSSAPKAGGCCREEPVSQGQDQKARHPSPADHPSPPGCPCKQGSECEVVLPPAPDEAYQNTARAAIAAPSSLLASPPDQLTPTGCALPVFREPPARGPSVSTDDLLYSFHMLRC